VRDVVAMPSTGVPRERPTEVEAGVEDGMPTRRHLVAENAPSAEKAHLSERITEFGAARMSEICRALAIASGRG
jgi:mRNA-degrading endonuclease toxin of MazEF toxin-antitoxin module